MNVIHRFKFSLATVLIFVLLLPAWGEGMVDEWAVYVAIGWAALMPVLLDLRHWQPPKRDIAETFR